MKSSLNLLGHSFDYFAIFPVKSNTQQTYFMCSSSSTPGATNEALDYLHQICAVVRDPTQGVESF